MSQLLNGMNPRQKEAILYTQGPLLVMAGAGSGKTRVLTHRIAYLIEEQRVNPWQILAITFTNKAAREMKERLDALVGTSSRDLWVSTFHAMCMRILRREAQAIGYSKQFTIIDTSEQKTLMKKIIKELNLDDKRYSEKVVLSIISDAKNQSVTPQMFQEQAASYFEEGVSKCYDLYEKQLVQKQLMDFDDLIIKTVQLFKERPDILEEYQRKFQYIHVDEYQDTNAVQYELVLQLSHYHQNICVVGDADQSIYGWRGADMGNILNFEKDFPNAKTILLEQNYRSTQTILDAANDVIMNNQERIAKKLWTQNAVGEKIAYYRAFSEQDEASFVATKMKQLLSEKVHAKSYQDFAVLYRTNAQSRAIEDALRQQVIPYKIYGGLRFYDRAEIKDVLAYLRLMANPNDDLSFERVVNAPKRSVGKSSLEKLTAFANQHGISLYQAAKNSLAVGLPAKATKGISQFVTVIENCQEKMDKMNMTNLVDEVLEKSGYLEALQMENTLESQSRVDNIEEFKSVTKLFDESPIDSEQEDLPAIVRFLSDFALDNTVEEESGQEVTLMTLHSAKGLEFPVVFLVGMEETIFPTHRSIDENDMEEERRLMYVGITRAEKKLFLTHASSRLLYGKTQRNGVSRFIDEIQDERMESAVSKPLQKRVLFQEKESKLKTSLVQKQVVTKQNNANVSWSVGDKVSHAKWGIGRIVRISGSDTDKMLDIAFDGQGIKTLLASFAPITKA